MTTNERAGIDWTTMRAQDFDASLELSLFDLPTQPIPSAADAELVLF